MEKKKIPTSTSFPLSELDALRLEKLELQAQLLNLQGERDALKTKRQLDEAVTAFQQIAKEIAERDGVDGWQLDLERRRWVALETVKKVQ